LISLIYQAKYLLKRLVQAPTSRWFGNHLTIYFPSAPSAFSLTQSKKKEAQLLLNVGSSDAAM
jgi:hypothetical protein